MKAWYDTETLQVRLTPESEDERKAVLKMVQVFTRGGHVISIPDGKKPLTTKYSRQRASVSKTEGE